MAAADALDVCTVQVKEFIMYVHDQLSDNRISDAVKACALADDDRVLFKEFSHED